jgi:hypothetical protein
MEIGLGCFMRLGTGNSLKLWRAYLPCAKISFLEHMRWVGWEVGQSRAGRGLLLVVFSLAQRPCLAALAVCHAG